MYRLNLLVLALPLCVALCVSAPAHAQGVSCNVKVTTDKDRVRVGEGFTVEFFTGETPNPNAPVPIAFTPTPRFEYEIYSDDMLLVRGVQENARAFNMYERFTVPVSGLRLSGLKNISVRLSPFIALKPAPANCVNSNIATTLINVMAPDPIPILATSYTGLWWNQATDGQGVFFTQNSPSNIAFIGWFTYDKDGRQKWYAGDRCDMGTTSGGFNGNVCTTTLYETSDGKFDGATFNGAQIRRLAVGEAGFKFHSNQAVTMTYSLNGISGKLELQRQPF